MLEPHTLARVGEAHLLLGQVEVDGAEALLVKGKKTPVEKEKVTNSERNYYLIHY